MRAWVQWLFDAYAFDVRDQAWGALILLLCLAGGFVWAVNRWQARSRSEWRLKASAEAYHRAQLAQIVQIEQRRQERLTRMAHDGSIAATAVPRRPTGVDRG